MKPLPSIEYLRLLFSYDPDTGIVVRKTTTSPRAKEGDIVGTKHTEGYLVVSFYINKKEVKCKLHRVCWALHWGRDPYPMQIDHINQKRNDNRIVNLRLATNQDNQKNQGRKKNNTSGVTGVHFHKKAWEARIQSDDKNIYVGRFKNKADAIAARKAAEVKYGFHENHGQEHDAPKQPTEPAQLQECKV